MDNGDPQPRPETERKSIFAKVVLDVILTGVFLVGIALIKEEWQPWVLLIGTVAVLAALIVFGVIHARKDR